MLIAAGIALIMEQKASISGAVGGCQAETGTAAAMGSGAIVYCLGGSNDPDIQRRSHNGTMYAGIGVRPGCGVSGSSLCGS